MGFRRTAVRARLVPSQAASYDEVEQLLKILRVRSNRDKLEDHQFLLAGSLLERWKWNSRIIRDDDLREFLKTARELVNAIQSPNQQAKQSNAKR